MRIELEVNGQRRTIDADPMRTLLSVLHDELLLTGTKYGCGEAQCGACTVMVDGAAVRSCHVEFGTLGGASVTTIEGLETNGKLHPVQQSFIDEGAMQCGFCTAGMIMSAVALLKSNPSPNASAIVQAMNGNVCRCGTYPRVVAAIQRAARTNATGERGAEAAP
jgi:aerobic-type carbon monoxide dehydrogenase small subunit (CoxS/CutS family)